uniref:Iron-sulfur cluster assembly SufBD family protein ycf24 n=1 Tax=Cyanidium sp. THAL103 TaxID=3027999 RepID=A0A9Y1MXX7_9RHOD|nr:putative ABC transporter [Cyanidium sp. THAL103]
MVINNKTEFSSKIDRLINQPYKYGFVSKIQSEKFPTGINENIIKLISSKKKEPNFLTQFRLKAFKIWQQMTSSPSWGHVNYAAINFQNILYYAVPAKDKNLNDPNALHPEIIKTFEKLGIPLGKKAKLSNVAMDTVFDSVSLGTSFQKELENFGILFCSLSEAVQKYPNLIQKYLSSVVPIGDNYFTALNSAVFTDGSFCYIPKNIVCPLDLSTYFRINNSDSGQFERTLIISEENSFVNYLEGCTAPRFDNNQLHAAVVELIAFKNATINYSTVQNWYSGDNYGKGGIFNFVTKRGLCIGDKSTISWTQVETGSSITWKYPSCILSGNYSKGEFHSIALTNNLQQSDTGTKMIHFGNSSKSHIISKGISAGKSKNTYRGLVKITTKANYSQNYSQCDSLLIGNQSEANTYPYIDSSNLFSKIEHEASTSKIGEEQIFYLQQRGLSPEEGINLILSGFCKEIFNHLPMEFALEADKLINLKLEGSIG